jgi:hypothetical protein
LWLNINNINERAIALLQQETHVSRETLIFLQSFFLSFDRQHRLRTSIVPCSMPFFDEEVVPHPVEVSNLFFSLLQHKGDNRPKFRGGRDDDEDRLGFSDFVRLLLLLRRHAATVYGT